MAWRKVVEFDGPPARETLYRWHRRDAFSGLFRKMNRNLYFNSEMLSEIMASEYWKLSRRKDNSISKQQQIGMLKDEKYMKILNLFLDIPVLDQKRFYEMIGEELELR